MIKAMGRLAAAGALSLLASGCSTTSPSHYARNSPFDQRLDRHGFTPYSASRDGGGSIETPPRPLQCVTYARERSGINLRGDASEWWEAAQGRFSRKVKPSDGAIMVLTGYAGPRRAHLAVVRDIVSSREIHVDHANWLDDGAIYLDDAVADVSPENDWSEVRVFNLRTHAWGVRTYIVQGFIGPGTGEDSLRVAERD